MQELALKYRIGLFLVARIEQARNSYGLTKWLSWGFKIIEVVEITNFLAENQLIDKQLSPNGINNYSVTKQGEAFVQEYEKDTYDKLVNEYGEDNMYLRAVFGKL